MFIPLYDGTPYKNIVYPYINWMLIAINIAAFLLFQSGYIKSTYYSEQSEFEYTFGMVPVVLMQTMNLPSDYLHLPGWMTLVTYAFVHGSWMHLAGNILFLRVLGDNIEDDFGHIPYLCFYLASAFFAGLFYALASEGSQSPLIGSSGAVSAVVAAYMVLHPRSRLWILALFRIPLRLPAFWAIGVWIVYQVWVAGYGYFIGANDDVAWLAHVGGLAEGVLLALVFKWLGVSRMGQRPRHQAG